MGYHELKHLTLPQYTLYPYLEWKFSCMTETLVQCRNNIFENGNKKNIWVQVITHKIHLVSELHKIWK